MSKVNLGERLIVEALNDSYYPDMGQVVSAEHMVNVINSCALIAAAPEMLETLKNLVRAMPKDMNLDGEQLRGEALAAIAKAEGNYE